MPSPTHLITCMRLPSLYRQNFLEAPAYSLAEALAIMQAEMDKGCWDSVGLMPVNAEQPEES